MDSLFFSGKGHGKGHEQAKVAYDAQDTYFEIAAQPLGVADQ